MSFGKLSRYEVLKLYNQDLIHGRVAAFEENGKIIVWCWYSRVLTSAASLEKLLVKRVSVEGFKRQVSHSVNVNNMKEQKNLFVFGFHEIMTEN